MRVTWVNRSFLGYRVPVYAELDRLLGGRLSVVFSTDATDERVQAGIASALGVRAVGLTGERTFVGRRADSDRFANTSLHVGFQPGLLAAIHASAPDVVIGEGFFQWTAAAFARRLRHGTPVVLSYERTAHTERNAQWYRTLYRRQALRLVACVCCNGRLSAQYVRALGMPAERVLEGAMAADTRAIEAAARRVEPAEKQRLLTLHGLRRPLFLSVGQLIERKGVRELLEAWARYKSDARATDGATLLFVGEGPERSVVQEALRLGRVRDVVLAGAVDHEALPTYYALADAFVLATLEDNWSLVVPEAMACGLPILSSRHNGCWPELVLDGTNGYTFDPADAQAAAAAIGRIGADAGERRRMGGESRRIVERFSPQAAAGVFHEACRRSLASPR